MQQNVIIKSLRTELIVSTLFKRAINGQLRQLSTTTFRYSRGRKRSSDGLANYGNKVKNDVKGLSLSEAMQAFKSGISSLDKEGGELNLYLGTGQYFDNPQRDRVIVLHSETEFDFGSTQTPGGNSGFMNNLLDCSLLSDDVDKFSDELGKHGNNICNGEVNSIGMGSWSHGFVIGDEFKIFSQNALICKLGRSSFKCLLNDRIKDIPIQNVNAVRVMLSEEPWNEQAIVIECQNEELIPLLTLSYENDFRDLAMLMVDTEWSVKTAALLCLKLRKLGNQTAQLKLPKVLTLQGNPWVENRHALWTRFSNIQ